MLEVVYVDLPGKRLVEVVPKMAFAPLFREVRPRRLTKFSRGL